MAEWLQLTIGFQEFKDDTEKTYFAARLVIDQPAKDAGFVAEDGLVTASSYTRVGAVCKLVEEINWNHRKTQERRDV